MIDLAATRRALEGRLRALAHKLVEIEGDLTEHEEDDFEERASEIAGDEVLEGLGTAGLREVEQIRAALKRIAEGSYGECARCGEPIDERRLKAVPHAANCIDCERDIDRATSRG